MLLILCRRERSPRRQIVATPRRLTPIASILENVLTRKPTPKTLNRLRPSRRLRVRRIYTHTHRPLTPRRFKVLLIRPPFYFLRAVGVGHLCRNRVRLQIRRVVAVLQDCPRHAPTRPATRFIAGVMKLAS